MIQQLPIQSKKSAKKTLYAAIEDNLKGRRINHVNFLVFTEFQTDNPDPLECMWEGKTPPDKPVTKGTGHIHIQIEICAMPLAPKRGLWQWVKQVIRRRREGKPGKS